jgi:hypothetical protein
VTDARTDPVPIDEAKAAVRFLQHLLAGEYRHLRRLEAGRVDAPDGWCDTSIPPALLATWIRDSHAAIARLEADLVKITAQQSRNRKATR